MRYLILAVFLLSPSFTLAAGIGEDSSKSPYAGSLFDQVSDAISTRYAYEMNPSVCGYAPDYNRGSDDAWYKYGDCTGDYGPIDAAE